MTTIARTFLLAVALTVPLVTAGCFNEDFYSEMAAQILYVEPTASWCSSDPAAPPQLLMIVANAGAEPNAPAIVYLTVHCDGAVTYTASTDGNDVHYLFKRLSCREREEFMKRLPPSQLCAANHGYKLERFMPLVPLYMCTGMDAFMKDCGLSLSPDGGPLTAAQVKEYELPAWVLQAQGYSIGSIGRDGHLPSGLTDESLGTNSIGSIASHGHEPTMRIEESLHIILEQAMRKPPSQ